MNEFMSASHEVSMRDWIQEKQENKEKFVKTLSTLINNKHELNKKGEEHNE
ncbi:hypothetical protein [Paraliobacillus ryukyuensis]|uniref:hypothetical protein n=1 Tax=Paraliobacillus ryukyuensis TaxID=200904 RepID=UPI0015C4C9AF|nr:hypothetical protein [Paraliobacillus ryukyuensis]